MKNILCLVLTFVLVESISAQVMYIDQVKNDLNKQLDIDTEELKQFNDLILSFETALGSGAKDEITAIKLMIEQAMIREIEQGMNKNSGKEDPDKSEKSSSDVNANKKPIRQNRSVNITPEEKKSREERGKKYLEEKNKARGNIQNKPSDHAIVTKTSNPIVYKQQQIYNSFKGMDNPSSPFDLARLNKFILAFYDTMEEDLEETRKEVKLRK